MLKHSSPWYNRTTWYYNIYCVSTPNCGYTHYSVGQDTLLNEVSGSAVPKNSLFEGATKMATEVVILRQSNDTVFRYSPEAQSWHMLYDFGAQPGDIWNIQTDTYLGYGFEDETDLFKISVDSIDQINIGQNTHRVIYTSAWTDDIAPSDFHFSYNGGRIIEGIGPVDQSHGLIGQSIVESLPLQNPSFACFLINGELIWGSPDSPCNTVSVEEANRSVVELILFPNPVCDVLHISSGNENLKSGTVYNSIGLEVLSFSTNNRDANLDIHHFNPGVYIVKVRLDNGKTAIGRLVKGK